MKRDFNEIMKDYHSGNEALKNKAMLDACDTLEGCIMHIATRSYKSYLKKDAEDIQQCGRLGIIKGLANYDVDRGKKPTTFFYPYIQHEIQDFINKNHNNNTIHYETANNKILRAQKALTDKGVSVAEITDIQLSELTGLPLSTVRTARMIKNRTSVLEFNDGKDESGNFLPAAEEDREDNIGESPEDQLIRNEKSRVIAEAIDSLEDDIEREIIIRLYGFGEDRATMKAVAKDLGITVATVKAKQASALAALGRSKLKEYFNIKNNDAFLDDEITLFPASSYPAGSEYVSKSFEELFLS